MQHALILAGGSGTRLWPASRSARPKQLLKLIHGRSLLELAWERAARLVLPRQIWIVTGQRYAREVCTELPQLDPLNLIGEPIGRDTANAIGLATAMIAGRDPDATLAVLTADHLITPLDRFESAVRTGLAAAERWPAALVTFGVAPSSAHTGYGYLRRGERTGDGVYRVREFREKPGSAQAQEYIAAGDFYWNSGMFSWRASALIAELSRQLPQNSDALLRLAAELASGNPPGDWAERWASLRPISIDYGVMEHAADVRMVELACEWSDMGSWLSIGASVASDACGNSVLAPQALLEKTEGTIVVSDDQHLVVACGLKNLVVVHTPDATLVCHKDDLERLRELAERRRLQFGERFE